MQILKQRVILATLLPRFGQFLADLRDSSVEPESGPIHRLQRAPVVRSGGPKTGLARPEQREKPSFAPFFSAFRPRFHARPGTQPPRRYNAAEPGFPGFAGKKPGGLNRPDPGMAIRIWPYPQPHGPFRNSAS